MTLGRRLAAKQKTFHIIKIQKMAGISKYYRTKLLKTCGVVDLRSSDALRRETEYVNAQL